MKENKDRLLIIGIGNEFRGDDAFGIKMIEYMQLKHPDIGEYLIIRDDFSRLLNTWKDRNVIVIDAVCTPFKKAGKIHRFYSPEELLFTREILLSTHGLGLLETLHLAETLDCLPHKFLFIGVEGLLWDIGASLSVEMTLAIKQVHKEAQNYIAEEI